MSKELYKYKEMDNYITCSMCGIKQYSSYIEIDQFTRLPVCAHHELTYTEELPYKIPTEQVPVATGNPPDEFITFEVPD